MEQKIKAIEKALEVKEGKLTNGVMSAKLKLMELDGTGNKETLVNRIFDALKLKVGEPSEDEKRLAVLDELGDKRTADDNIERDKLRKDLLGIEKKEPNEGMKKTAGFYAKYMASRNNVQGQETPIYNFDKMEYIRTIVLPHSAAKSLNIQKLNSGIVYKEVESKKSK